MKKVTRIGVIVLTVSFSLILISVLRGNSPYGPFSLSADSPADNWTLYSDFLLPPRDLKIEIQANSTVDVYILDQAGTLSWKADGALQSLWSFTEVKQEAFTVQLSNRGTYAILTHNPSNSVTSIKVSITLYGFERDLLWASIVFAMAGAVITVVSALLSRKTKK